MSPAGSTAGGRRAHPTPVTEKRLRVLLIEDDDGDAFLVSELLDEVAAPIDLTIAASMAEAKTRLAGIDCVLLDLGLPDASGLDGLRALLQHTAAQVAVCVLTGLSDEYLGVAAVAEGAQDYLVKSRVDGTALTRSVRFAVERRRADDNARQLREARLREGEAVRLERGLLPKPLMDSPAVQLVTCYRPGRQRALLGGDFYDAIQTAPQRFNLLVGDVCGHGAEEAALGVALRVAWRALTLAGVPDTELLSSLERVLISERRAEEIFATVATVGVDLAAGEAVVHKCGHPPPLLISRNRATSIAGHQAVMLGVLPGATWQPVRVPLPDGAWSILIYTDGLIEGRTPDGRLGLEGLRALVDEHRAARRPLASLPDWLVEQAERRNGGPLADDVAMLLLTKESG